MKPIHRFYIGHLANKCDQQKGQINLGNWFAERRINLKSSHQSITFISGSALVYFFLSHGKTSSERGMLHAWHFSCMEINLYHTWSEAQEFRVSQTAGSGEFLLHKCFNFGASFNGSPEYKDSLTFPHIYCNDWCACVECRQQST